MKASEQLSLGKFEFTPSRRVIIPKLQGGTRPLGINSPREKIVQKALAVILEHIWENEFLETSHGFRPRKSIHTALNELYLRGGAYTWTISGDISKCFDQIPHETIMKCVRKRIKCHRTLELIQKILSAGYVDPDTGAICRDNVGTPQGSILSPILSNIVLHEQDKHIEDVKTTFNNGRRRKHNPTYVKLSNMRRSAKTVASRKQLLKEMRKIPAFDPMDPDFKRLKYIRYADDFVILVIGKYSDAKKIRTSVKDFLLHKCGLTLNMDKTIITNIHKEGFKFLGAHCRRPFITSHVVKHKRHASTGVAPGL